MIYRSSPAQAPRLLLRVTAAGTSTLLGLFACDGSAVDGQGSPLDAMASSGSDSSSGCTCCSSGAPSDAGSFLVPCGTGASSGYLPEAFDAAEAAADASTQDDGENSTVDAKDEAGDRGDGDAAGDASDQ